VAVDERLTEPGADARAFLQVPLRGAGLWHLATAETLPSDLPELTLLTFDARLAAAAEGEGLRRPA
jgi:hypothetical protein